MNDSFESLYGKNPNIRFIVDNYDILCHAHRGKTILVMDCKVKRVFDNEVDAVSFAHAVKLHGDCYAMKPCIGDAKFLMMTSANGN